MRRPRPFVRCLITGCNAESYCKRLCTRHYQQSKRHGTVAGDTRAQTVMQSVCCGVAVYEGRPHDCGKQYCSRCSQPCFWRSVPLPT